MIWIDIGLFISWLGWVIFRLRHQKAKGLVLLQYRFLWFFVGDVLGWITNLFKNLSEIMVHASVVFVAYAPISLLNLFFSLFFGVILYPSVQHLLDRESVEWYEEVIRIHLVKKLILGFLLLILLFSIFSIFHLPNWMAGLA
jgi:hypothetical protein